MVDSRASSRLHCREQASECKNIGIDLASDQQSLGYCSCIDHIDCICFGNAG